MVLALWPIFTFLFAVHTVMSAPANPLTSFNHDVPNGCADPSKGVKTPYGVVNGYPGYPGVVRFAVKYATASRWHTPTAVESWIMPNNDVSALPPACPQTGMDPSQYSEDCLYLVLYVPVQAAMSGSPLHTLTWIHGGSFYSGAATNPGLDGSALALSLGAIVTTVQYRLGVLGWLPPTTLSSGINLGVKDVMQALKFLNKVLPSFGGAANQITLAGQSSGAMMIRGTFFSFALDNLALIASPTAAPMFKGGILQSDPMYYNFLPSAAHTALQQAYYGALPCSTTDTACITSVPLPTLLSVQDALYNNASTISPAAGAAEPLRPSVDGSFITTSLTGNSFPSNLKPLVITTVLNDAGLVIGTTFQPNTPESNYQPILEATFGSSRTAALLSSQWYSENMLQVQTPTADRTRVQLERLGTEATWRCPNWSFARSYVAKGGRVYVGRFMLGATYINDPPVNYCTVEGRVCHQDDIYITFGTTPHATLAQSKLTKEIQARWGAFARTGVPNPTGPGYGTWNPATTTDVHALQLGPGGGEARDGACNPGFWGNQVKYDWQIYGVN